MSGTTEVLNPDAFEVTLYLPAFRFGTSYVPASPVFEVLEILVPWLVTCTSVFGTTAPVESVTVPVIAPKVAWPEAIAGQKRRSDRQNRFRIVFTRSPGLTRSFHRLNPSLR